METYLMQILVLPKQLASYVVTITSAMFIQEYVGRVNYKGL